MEADHKCLGGPPQDYRWGNKRLAHPFPTRYNLLTNLWVGPPELLQKLSKYATPFFQNQQPQAPKPNSNKRLFEQSSKN